MRLIAFCLVSPLLLCFYVIGSALLLLARGIGWMADPRV